MFPKLDLHTHSRFSDGKQTLQEIFNEAQRNDLMAVAVTDHHTNTSFLDAYDHVNGLEEIRVMKEKCRTISEGSQTRFLLGVEADIIDLDGCLNIKPEIAAEVDFVIASLHIIPGVETRWEKLVTGDVGVDRKKVVSRCFQAEIAALRNGQVDVLGHPMYVVSAGKYLKSVADLANGLLSELVETAAKRGVAVEINGQFYRDLTQPTNYLTLFRMCLENGVKLSTGTDAHQPLFVGDLSKIHNTLMELEARSSDLYNPAGNVV